jgi:enoyl-CoA hydratase
VPEGQALAKAQEIATRIARNGPIAVKGIVPTLRETESLPEADAYEIEQRYRREVHASDDARTVRGPFSKSARRCSQGDSAHSEVGYRNTQRREADD